MKQSDLSPELSLFHRIVNRQPFHLRDPFRYALVMVMIEEGTASIIERRTVDGRRWLTIQTVAGEQFNIVKPDMAREALAQLMQMARRVAHAEKQEEDLTLAAETETGG